MEPDGERFPCLELAYRAGKTGGTLPACLNAANEVAVEQFRKGNLKFIQIPELIGQVMERHAVIANPVIGDLVQADLWSRRTAEELVMSIHGASKRG